MSSIDLNSLSGLSGLSSSTYSSLLGNSSSLSGLSSEGGGANFTTMLALLKALQSNGTVNNSTLTSTLQNEGSTQGATTNNELLIQLLQSALLQSTMNGSESSSDLGGAQVALTSLLNALNKKQRDDKLGTDLNNSSDYTSLDLNSLLLQATTGININGTNSATSTSGTTSERIEKAISAASKKYGVDADLIRSVIKNESGFNPNAVSSAGAMGLMQLMPANVRAYGLTDGYNIEQNIDAGTNILSSNLAAYHNDVALALAAYNYGSGNLSRRGITSHDDFYKLPEETKNYIRKVEATYQAYKAK